MTIKPTSSIVIVNHNSGHLLGACIESVRENTDDYEIVLVDNNSEDGSIKSIKPGPDLRLTRLAQNVGFARANNEGINMSHGRYIVLLNADTLVTQSWLNRLIAAAEQSATIGLVTPKLLRPGPSHILDSTGHNYQYETAICFDRGRGQLDEGQYDHQIELPSCCFACVLIKREVISRIGLLDGKMFIYFEDVDFSLRARIAGWRVLFCPESIVYHHRGGATAVSEGNWFGYMARAYPLRIILKIYQTKHAIVLGGRSFLLFLVGAIAGAKNRDWSYAKSNLRAIAWNIANIPLKERVKVQRRRRIPDKRLFQP
jgi:GT2 family glycosyltransferase